MNLLVNELGAAASRAGAAMLAQTAVLVLALLAVELIAGRRLRATLRCGLWLLVVVKLLLPPSFSLPSGVAYWLGPWLVAPVKVNEPNPPGASVSVSLAELDDAWPSASDHRAAVQPPAPPPLSVPGRLALAWLAGSAAMLGLIIRRNLEVHRWVRGSHPATPDQEQALAEAASQIGLSRRPQFRFSPAEHSPAVCGLLYPVVVLPKALAERLSPSALRDVLLHELIHIHRRDLWWNLPQTLAVVVWWWNPLVWLANARVRALREQAVDERVMLVRHGDPEAYPATLVEVARHCATRPTFALSFVGILESRRALRTRVERLLSSPVPQRANLGAAGWTVVLLAALLSLPMAFARRAEVSPTLSAEPDPNPRLLEVQANEPRYRLNGEPIAEENLATKLREWAAAIPGGEVTVAADLAESSAELDRVIEAARAAGFRSLNLVPPQNASAETPARSNIRGYVVLDLALPTNGAASPNRYGVIQPATNFYQMDPQLARRYGLLPPPPSPGSAAQSQPAMSPELMRRYGLLPTADTNPAPSASPEPTFYSMDPVLARRYGLVPQANAARSTPGVTYPNEVVFQGFSQELAKELTGLTRLAMSKELLNNLRQKSGGELRHMLSVSRPTPLLQTLLADLAIAEQKKATLTPNYGPDHPEVKRITGVIAKINAQIDDVVAGILASMQAQIDADQAALKAINTQLPPANSDASARSEAKPALLSDPARPEESRRWGLGHQIITTKLKGIVVPEFRFPGGTLAELVKYLEEQSRALDPERKGLNFIINQPEDSERVAIDPVSGQSRKLSEFTFRPLTPLNNVRLVDALDAMMRLADRPLRYEIEDYAVVFSVPPPPSTQFYTRTYRVNAASFLQGVQAATGLTLDPDVTDPKTRGGQIQKAVREYFMACGVEFPSSGTPEGTSPPANQRALFFNDRTGVLFVRAPREDLEVVQKAVEALNVAPPQILLETRFIELDPPGSEISMASSQFYFDHDSNSMAAIFSPSELEVFLKSLEQKAKVLAAPKVTTLTGRQAQISVAQEALETDPTTGGHPIGPVLNVIPWALADSQSIQLNLIAELHRLVRTADGDQVTTATFSTTKPVPPGHTLMLMTSDNAAGGDPSAKRANPMLVFVTPTIIDPAGNRVSPPEK